MRIIVKEEEGRAIRVLLPTGLFLNSFTAAIAAKQMERYGVSLTRKQAVTFVKTLNRYRKSHREWVLVEVQSADGDYVKIKL